MDYKLELVLIPVTDVDRAKAFYTEEVGFRLDVDHRAGAEFRVVQMTPPGSACSISIGIGLTDSQPGSARGMHLVVRDIVAARSELVQRGVSVGEIRHLEEGAWVPGPDPQRQDYGSLLTFRTRTATPGSSRKLAGASQVGDRARSRPGGSPDCSSQIQTSTMPVSFPRTVCR